MPKAKTPADRKRNRGLRLLLARRIELQAARERLFRMAAAELNSEHLQVEAKWLEKEVARLEAEFKPQRTSKHIRFVDGDA